MRWRRGFACAVVVALGCSTPVERGATRGDAGTGNGAKPPLDQFADANTPQQAADAATASDDAAMHIDLPPNFTLDCSSEATAAPPGDPRAAWEAERLAHGPLGHEATFSLLGTSYRVHGAAVTTVRAPFTLHSGNTGSGGVAFADATVDDVDASGRLVLYPGSGQRGQLPATAGTIEALPLKTVTVEDGMLQGVIDLVEERVGNTDFYRTTASFDGLALENVAQAYLYPEGTTGLDERIEWMPSAPVVLRDATSLTFYEADVGSVTKTMSDPIDLDYAAFGVAGDFSAGSLDVEGIDVRGTPVAVFGQNGNLHAGRDSIDALEGFRVTQAVNEAGLVLTAEVEIVPEEAEVWVPPSGTRVVHLHYRERSFGGDAVLGEIRIGGAAEDLLELQTAFPPTLTGEIIEAVLDTGWAAPLAALAALPTVSIVFVIDIFDCIFGGCADLPPPLEPFPQWLDAGAIGTMEVRVKGDLAPGTYDTSLTFVGRNYCPVTVPLTVHVGDPPADADAGQ